MNIFWRRVLVHSGNLFPTSTKRSYDAFHPFVFQGEIQKKFKKFNVQMTQREKMRN
jgi:hypothetical protein